MKKDKKFVSVVIPSIGRETLQQCLDALEGQTRQPNEVLVVHDTDDQGISITRNKGIMQAKGDLIVFTDDDCVPPDNWIENLMGIQEQYDADVVGGTLRETDPLLHAKRMRYPFPSIVQEDTSGVVGNSANIMLKRSLFDECLRNDGYIYDKNPGADWLKALWVKVIGPFDIKSFPTFKDYFVLWLGEKIQGFGFLWGTIVYNYKL